DHPLPGAHKPPHSSGLLDSRSAISSPRGAHAADRACGLSYRQRYSCAAHHRRAGSSEGWRLGFLSPYSPDYDATWRAGFRNGLRDLGYVERKTIVIEERHVRGRLERYPALAEELVRLQIDVFVVHGGEPSQI